MEIDYGEKRSQIIIAGILVFVIVAIFVGFALVVGGLKTDSQNRVLPLFDKVLNDSGISTFGQDTDVSVGKGDCIDDIPTAAGEISALSWYFPALEWTELPLCITDADIASWYIDLYVKGGYEPVTGTITFTQEGVYQYIYITWTETVYECWSVWTATFTTDDGLIKFESSEDPVIDLPFPYNYCGDGFDEKLVDLCWCTGWIGCDFYILQPHKGILPDSPNFRLNFIANCKGNSYKASFKYAVWSTLMGINLDHRSIIPPTSD